MQIYWSAVWCLFKADPVSIGGQEYILPSEKVTKKVGNTFPDV